MGAILGGLCIRNLEEYKKKCMRSQEFRAEYERIQKEEDNRIVDPEC